MFEKLSLWDEQKILPAPYVSEIHCINDEGIDGIKDAFSNLASRKAIGKIVLDWKNSKNTVSKL